MILVAGIGNIFLGDDAFGVEVVQQMLREAPIAGVQLIDFGIRGLDLTYALVDEKYAAVVLVDAVPRGTAAGTLFVIEPSESDFEAPAGKAPTDEPLIDAHNMHPLKVLRLARSMGSTLSRIVVVGCEPTPFDPETQMQITISPPVIAAIPAAIDLIRERIAIFQQELKGAEKDESSIAVV